MESSTNYPNATAASAPAPGPTTPDRGASKTTRIMKIALVLMAVVALVVASKLLPVKEYFESFLEWNRSLGAWGPIALGAVYVVATVLFVPGSILTLGAGFLFGVVWGTVTVSIASTLGACAAFLVGRTVARDAIARKVSANPKFTAIDEAVRDKGFKIVLLTRLSPIFPFVFLNYAFGLTKVAFRNYALASWIGMLPGTVMYVYVGSTLGSLAQLAAGTHQKTPAEWAFFAVGLVVTVAVTVYVTKIARAGLKRNVDALETAPVEAQPNRSES